jgi:type II secretory pathway pseudopilin PulG
MPKLMLSRKLGELGFTLIELLLAAAMGVIITGVAIGGLINAQEASRKSDQKLVQQTELQRALNYIATDIQEGQQIRIDQYQWIQTSGYKLVFYILRANQGRVGYYVKQKNSRIDWRGPVILYRKRWPGDGEDFDTPGVDDIQHALIDAIALSAVDNPKCQSSAASGLVDPLKYDIIQPTLGGKNVGVRVVVPKGGAPSRAVICLRGNQALSGGSTGLDVSIDAAVRIRPTP